MDKQGFTLVELAIVIVIISLIIGTITVGGTLIRNSEMQTVSKEMRRHLSAIQTFQDKYQALPGDFSQVTTYFTAIVNGVLANGNGDGLVTFNTEEEFQVWLHLKAMELTENNYSGASTSNKRVVGTNIPTSQVSGAGWAFVYVPTTSTDLLYSTGDTPPGHVLWLGGNSMDGTNNLQYPALSASEAETIDQALDDGVPSTGKIIVQDNTNAIAGYTTLCQSSASAYNITASGKICALVFKTGF